jgi:hypothetical protein
MVSAVNWNDVVVHADLSFDHDLKLIFSKITEHLIFVQHFQLRRYPLCALPSHRTVFSVSLVDGINN